MIEADFHPGALAEAEEAQLWYENKREGLGETFAAAVERAINRITEAPHFARADGDEVRRLVLERFPYSVVYVVLDSRIVVLAVAHSRRQPGYWRHRLRSLPQRS